MFTKVGLLSYPADAGEDTVMEAALEAGADDVVVNEDGSIDVLTDPDAFSDVKAAMDDAGLESENAEVTMRPDNNTDLGADDAQKMIRLLDMLEELDDTQKVYSNASISDDILASLED